MIVWINGPFGAGKTTLAKELTTRSPETLIFDPEELRFIVKADFLTPPGGDFQDLPLWRDLTVAALREIRRHYSQTIIVPMTLVQPDYLADVLGRAAEIDNRFLHVFLTLDEEILRQRIVNQKMHPDPGRDAQIREWRLAQVERCLAATHALPQGTVLLDSSAHTPGDLADKVLNAMEQLRCGSAGPASRGANPPKD